MQEDIKEAFGEWLSRYPWDWWATFTFRRPLANPILAKKHFESFMGPYKDVFYFVAVERFFMKDDCHLHALLGNCSDLSAKEFWAGWYKKYGRCRTEAYNAGLGARFYLFKYVTKDLFDWDFRLGQFQGKLSL